MHYRLRNDRIAGLIVLANIQHCYMSCTSTSSNIMQFTRACFFQKSWCIRHTRGVLRGQSTNGCRLQHAIILTCKLSLLPFCFWHGIPTRPVSCRSVCLWGGRSAKTLRSRCVCNTRWGTGFMGSALDGLALQLPGKWKASSSYLRWHSPACWNKGQRRELDSSNDAISPSVTGLALIRVSQDVIWVYHESLNWERPFTRPKWQILLSSHLITVLKLK